MENVLVIGTPTYLTGLRKKIHKFKKKSKKGKN